MQIILEYTPCGPLTPPRLPAAPSPFGDGNSVFRGKLATSEKKKEVLMVGVRGVRGAVCAPPGVFNAEPKPPPGEKNPFAVGDWSQASTKSNHGSNHRSESGGSDNPSVHSSDGTYRSMHQKNSSAADPCRTPKQNLSA